MRNNYATADYKLNVVQTKPLSHPQFCFLVTEIRIHEPRNAASAAAQIRVRDALNITGANTHDAVHPDLNQG